MPSTNKTVIVGMSGGVDSSVAALLLKQQGYRVIGMFMKNWEEQDENGLCTSTHDYEDVVRVSEALNIPCYSVNFAEQYWDNVFEHFLSELRQGYTPNPDILCNREIKFKVLLEKAFELGGDFLATGHYVRKDAQNRLCKGLDPNKDQSYFLHAITSEQLKHVLFPVGELEKAKVRALAKEHHLATAEKKDSTGICFIGKRNFKEFVSNYLPYHPGNLETPEGEVVGRHDGAAYYTIGQRKGLGIGGAGEAWFVVEKDIEKNIVVVAQGSEHPSLFRSHLVANELTWVTEPPAAPHRCHAKVRYRQSDQVCTIESLNGDRAAVTFDEPQRAVTLGQSVVFYDGDICLGGGIIRERS